MILIMESDSEKLKEKLMKIILHHHFPSVELAERKARKAYKWLKKHEKPGERITEKPPTGIRDGIVLLARCNKARALHHQQLQQAKAHIKGQVHPEGKGEPPQPLDDA
jgi:hypothetical protein